MPVSPDSTQQHPETTVQIGESWPFCRPMEDGELLSQSEILEGKRTARFESGDEPAKERRYHAAIVTLACGEDQKGRARMNK